MFEIGSGFGVGKPRPHGSYTPVNFISAAFARDMISMKLAVSPKACGILVGTVL